MDFSTSWHICHACKGIPTAIFKPAQVEQDHQFHRLHSTFEVFKESALRGCHTCTLFYEAVREPYKSSLELSPVYLERVVGTAGQPDVVLTADIKAIGRNASDEEIALQASSAGGSKYHHTVIAGVQFTFDADQVPAGVRKFKDLISLYPEQLAGPADYITKALRTCLSQHKGSCNRVVFPHSSLATQSEGSVHIVHGDRGLVVAPTRLIYVGSGNAEDPPRLVPGRECLYKGGYLALSYCWGFTPKPAAWHLTHSVYEQWSSRLPIEELPQTLIDMMEWTRALGEHYVWIDSMCIFQDDTEDWTREASRMASIYGSATMTIVSASSSVYGGLTDRRNPLRNTAAALTLSVAGGKQVVYILPNGQSPRTTPRPAAETRAWCYQEDSLSWRVVRFSQKGIVWECVGDGSSPNRRAQSLEQLTKHPPYRWYTLWYRLIEQYSNRNLTYPKDKLPAFSGIAADKAATGYFAGCLESDPWASLLWCRDEAVWRRLPGKRYNIETAPSWSWASLDVPVLFHEAKARSIRDPQLEPTHLDPIFLKLDAPQIPREPAISASSGTIEVSTFAGVAKTVPFVAPVSGSQTLSSSRGRRSLRAPSTGATVGTVTFDIIGECKNGLILNCVLLHVADVGLWRETGSAGLGLALILKKHNGRVAYCRVGYVSFTSAFLKCSLRQRVRIA